jgi:hypothetical protein
MLCPAAIVILLVTGLVQPWMIILLSIVVGITDALPMTAHPAHSRFESTAVARDILLDYLIDCHTLLGLSDE